MLPEKPLPANSPRVFLLLALGLLLVLALGANASAEGPAKSEASRQSQQSRRAQQAQRAQRDELLCPARAVIGEPFLVRVRFAQPVKRAELTFMGRSTPLALRKSGSGAGSGMEAVAVLGADVLDGRPGAQEVAVRAIPADEARGGRARVLKARVELVRIKRPVERLTLDPAMVTPPDEELPRIARERALTRQALAHASAERLWSLPFAHPVPGGLSSVYGIGRVLNGEPKAPHRGLDLEADTGQPVTAAAEGTVILTGGFYYAGNCVYLDHGQGLVSMYFHLSEVRVEQGQRVARGQLIGLAGDTGRSTRAHLHFGVSALGRLVDPAPLFLYDALP
ncbi:MAG: M23 family metallopeptidase [Desulfovibrio sp.]|jgi:murein DD-endopeptidase MepM/ murein hydrolase activator NlpD|nr:M23 family metallopeptidase [Desulfovibrio sp.]